jgi:hypothetical protein
MLDFQRERESHVILSQAQETCTFPALTEQHKHSSPKEVLKIYPRHVKMHGRTIEDIYVMLPAAHVCRWETHND